MISDALLTRTELLGRLALDNGDPQAIVVQPSPAALLGNSVSLDLHESFIEWSDNSAHRRLHTAEYLLESQKLVLATTRQTIRLPRDIRGQVTGNRELARNGLLVLASRIVDPGWSGHLMLELSNLGTNRVRLTEGMPIAEFLFYKAGSVPQRVSEPASLILDLSPDAPYRSAMFTAAASSPAVALEVRGHRQLFYPRTVSRFEVEHLDALHELERMLRDPRVREKDLQSFFTEFPYLLAGPDYTEIRSQVVLQLQDQGALIPDFFLQPVDQWQLWDIADIKLPRFRTVVHQRHRTRLSSAVMEGIAQLRTYSRYFDDPQNRDLAMKLHGISAYKPRLILIIGRAEPDVSPTEWRTIESEAAGVRLLNYDQVVELARQRLTGRFRR